MSDWITDFTVIGGSASKSIWIDLAKAADGTAATGIAYTAVTITYAIPGSSAQSVTLSALGSLTASYSSGGWFENSNGTYRFDIPNAAIAALTGGGPVLFTVAATACFASNFVLTVNSKNASTLNDIPAGTQMDLVSTPNATAITAIQSGLSKPATAQTITANQSVNVAQIAGQTANAAGAVTFPSSIGTSTFSGGAVASVTGSVGSIFGITFPTHFSTFAIDSSGFVTFNNSGVATATEVSAGTSTVTTAIGTSQSAIEAHGDANWSGSSSGPTLTEITEGVVDQMLAGHTNTGSVGAALNSAGEAGDPLATVLPGAYTDLQAGALIYQLHVTPTNQPIVAIPASVVSGFTQAYVYCRDGRGLLTSGVRIEFQCVAPPATDSFSTAVFDILSGPFGVLTVLLTQSTTYQARRGLGPWVSFTTGTDSTFALPQILGTP